jgi:5-methylcytosine-specific restriction protein A
MSDLYDRPRWKRVRARKLAWQPWCEVCRDHGWNVPAEVVDHIVAVAHGGRAYDLANLRALCERCHNAKTAATERHGHDGRSWYARGCGPDGMPTDPAHPWNQ